LIHNIYAIEKRQKNALVCAHRTKMEGFAQLQGVIFGLGCAHKKLGDIKRATSQTQTNEHN